MSTLLNRLVVVFGNPRSEDPTAYIQEIGRLLAQYNNATQQRAADYLVATFKPTYNEPWPLPSSIVSACVDAQEAITPNSKLDTDKNFYSTEAYSAAYRTLRNPANAEMVHSAGKDRWLNGLFNFVLRNQRMPTWAEAEKRIVPHSQFVERAANGEVNMGALHNELFQLANTMVARNTKLTDNIIHGVRDEP